MAGRDTYYVRLSLMDPKPGERERVVKMHEDLVTWLPGQPGFVRGYVIVSGDPLDRVGHMNVWRSMHDADQAAQTDHVLAIRSALLPLIDKDSHAEHSYETYAPTGA